MKIKYIVSLLIIFDILIGLLFVFSNLLVWDFLNGKLTTNMWGAYEITIIPQTIVNGTTTVIGTYSGKLNYPFILFWIALVGNSIISVFILRTKKD